MIFDFLPLESMAGAFALGLGGAVHCAGMCGGIVGAFSVSLEPKVRDSRAASSLYLGLLNLGRLVSYVGPEPPPEPSAVAPPDFCRRSGRIWPSRQEPPSSWSWPV